ncbi:MAG: oligosaccharide flippase family protein, partial [Erysipelotrichaceae bacterium]|nr:oligosaccharide flippase family protein [Erysipelotrichaceae bacterium]
MAAKQSLMVAALTSSFGIFVSKALGLIYYSPLSALAGVSNMTFYSITYTYYDLLLKISSAGIPFAIAALVARYYAKEDYKTVLLIKKLGTSLIMGLTFIVAISFLFLSGPLAAKSMGESATVEDIRILKNLFLILLIAVILVPYLSSVRGYYQGLKRLDLYGSSQALEQFVRVGSIISLGYLTVKVLNCNSIYAIYMAIAAAGIAAAVAIVFFKRMTKEDDKRIEELCKKQQSEAISKKLLIQEIIALGVPYLVISFLGSL